MDDLETAQQWHHDLMQLATELSLQDDPDIKRELSLIQIELDAMVVELNHRTRDLSDTLTQLHTGRIAERSFALLQSLVGYYALPDQPLGQNEPIIGPLTAHRLRSQLIEQQIDVFELKNTLAQLLEQQEALE